MQSLPPSLGDVPVDQGRSGEEVSRVRQEAGPTSDRPWGRNHFQGIRLLSDRLPQLCLQKGCRSGQESGRGWERQVRQRSGQIGIEIRIKVGFKFRGKKSREGIVLIRQPTCPICSNVLSPESRANAGLVPFCSERCRQIDLLRWCRGEYAIVEPLDPRQLASELPEPE